VFSPDGQTLLVARMGDGGVAGFDVPSRRYLGTVVGEKPTPRHLVISPDGRWVYLSSNTAGIVSRMPLDALVSAVRGANGGKVSTDRWEEVSVGSGARTIEITRDGRYLFAAINGRAEVAVVDAQTMQVVNRVRADSYTVGLAISPDGRQVWTTSQGRGSQGGNSVCVYEVRYDSAR
jgi:DNA-binding beta-propeller fold protein YncE